MTREKLKNAQRAAPFRPFTIRTADGSAFEVPHPDFLSISPSDRTVIVHDKKGGFSILDMLLMTEIEFNPPSAMSA
jgi:hypothetical protein